MTFGKTVLAYLTGWLIVQPVYNRVFGAWRRREMARPDGEYQTHLRAQAHAIVSHLSDFDSGRAPVALEVIVAQHSELDTLRGEVERLEGQLGCSTLTLRARTDALKAIAEYGEAFGSGPADDDMRAIAVRALTLEGESA